MLRGRSRLPLLAEISGPVDGRPWALGRQDFASLREALPPPSEQRVLAVVGEGEAPAITAISLAAAAAASGRGTILVECDLASPRLAGYVGLAAAPGLHEYLRWEADPRDVLQPVSLAGSGAGAGTQQLVCLAAGRPATKVETLLGLQSFAHMVAKLRGAYGLVVLLAPPVLSEPVSCLAVAAQANATVAGTTAVEANRRAGGELRAAVRRLPVPARGFIAVV
jgi:succinoglycan biosynthesis transport protein ExoP